MFIFDMRLRPPFPEYLNDSGAVMLYRKGVPLLWSKQLGTRISYAATERSVDLFFNEMEEAGITKGLIHGRKNSGISNDSVVENVNKYPDKFVGCINIVPTDGLEVCLQEIDNYIINGNCQGVFMESILDKIPWEMDDQELVYPIYETCQKNNIPVLFTLGGKMFSLPMRLQTFPQIDKISKDFPDMKIVLCHGGWPDTKEVIRLAMLHDNIYISPDVYMVNTPFHKDYIDAANCMLTDRILYGSAYPACDMRDAVNFYLNCGIKEAVLPKIMGENALSVFDRKEIKSISRTAFGKKK